MKYNVISRIRFISALVLIFASILVIRLYFVQIVYGEQFSNKADRQYIHPNQNLYDRGSIFIENKKSEIMEIEVAKIKSGFTVAINPKIIESSEYVYRQIVSVLPIDRDMFIERSSKKDDPYEVIAKRVDTKTAKKLNELSIKGLSIYKERWRSYLEITPAPQTIGFVGYNGDELSGRYGLERYYEDTLVRNNDGLYVNFFAEIFSNIPVFKSNNRRSGDIYTTIDLTVQFYLEGQIKNIHDKWNSKETAGVIINPHNGEIYAIGVYPTFDPNNFQKEENLAVFRNPIVEDVHEMGSIMKPLTMVAGIDAGVITAKTKYNDYGTLTLDGYTISNFDGRGRGYVSMQDVLSQSLNTGAVFVSEKMGKDTFKDYILAFGLGEETGIDLPNESAGLIKNLDSNRDIEYATASYGQGIAVTPIAMVRALSTLANGGVLITPHLVKKIKYDTGLFKTITYNDGQRILKEESVEEITRMLVKVVDEALLGGTVAVENYSIAAKTGTAQIAKIDEAGYYDDRYMHSFFGYFPAYDPQFLIFLYTLEPRRVRYASQTLTYPFMNIVSFLTNYYEVPPDR